MKNSMEKIDELINLKEWKTKKQINKELQVYGVQINERTLQFEDKTLLHPLTKEDLWQKSV